MELKNALAVCLISLFSATLVVLIARTLDSQAAARIEPQLARIVEELEAIRRQGGIPASPVAAGSKETVDDGLVVYYFHSNTRCPTCQAIESQSHETVQADFGPQLKAGEIVWKVLNYEQPAAKPLAEKFEVLMPVVVLVKRKGGQVQDWKRLDEVWGLVNDKPAFAAFLRGEVRKMLGDGNAAANAAAAFDKKPASPGKTPADLPLPSSPAELPLPQ